MKFDDGSARVKSYVCGLPGATKPQIQVEFDSLSEAAAGSLVEETPSPYLARAFGKWRVTRNDVFKEAKALFDAYGTKDMAGGRLYFLHREHGGPDAPYATATPSPSIDYKPPPARPIWYFLSPASDNEPSWNIPLPEEEKVIETTTHWPSGMRFYYRKTYDCDEQGFLGCTLLWRPAQLSDIANYAQNRRAFEQRIRLSEPPVVNEPNGEKPSAEEKALLDRTDAQFAAEQRAADEQMKRYISLVEHLNAKGWQSDFSTITGSGEFDCGGGGFNFSLSLRQMRLETVFVANISSQPMSIGSLIGTIEPDVSLRVNASPASVAAPRPLPAETITLAPGEKIAIPLRILFIPSGGMNPVLLTERFSNSRANKLAEAARIYQSILAMKPGTIIAPKKPGDPAHAIKKARESFGPPSAPDGADFAWGPAIDLRGVTLDGQRIDFDQGTPNTFTIAIGGDYGSCPYLYAFDESANAWVRHGKIIHNASGPEKEMTQRVEFAGLVNRFSIREEELEVSYIRSVRLEAQLRDGRSVELAPRDPTEAAAASLAVILSGEARDYAFALPEGVAPADVARSTLIVDGWYRRYSSLPIAQN